MNENTNLFIGFIHYDSVNGVSMLVFFEGYNLLQQAGSRTIMAL